MAALSMSEDQPVNDPTLTHYTRRHNIQPEQDFHCRYTIYLSHIINGTASCATESEQFDADLWEDAQAAHLAKLWSQDSTEKELLRILTAELTTTKPLHPSKLKRK